MELYKYCHLLTFLCKIGDFEMARLVCLQNKVSWHSHEINWWQYFCNNVYSILVFEIQKPIHLKTDFGQDFRFRICAVFFYLWHFRPKCSSAFSNWEWLWSPGAPEAVFDYPVNDIFSFRSKLLLKSYDSLNLRLYN